MDGWAGRNGGLWERESEWGLLKMRLPNYEFLALAIAYLQYSTEKIGDRFQSGVASAN